MVRRYQQAGHVVAMVGDGVNDAAALAQADLGLAMGSGTDIAIHASDLTLVRSDLTAVVDAIRLSRRTLGRDQAATCSGPSPTTTWRCRWPPPGLLNPMLAGAAMALSSVFVVSNSLRLRRFAGLPRSVPTAAAMAAAGSPGSRRPAARMSRVALSDRLARCPSRL